MSNRQLKTGNSAGTALLEAPNGERERVFDVFLGSTCCAGATHDVVVMQQAVENRR